MAGKKCPKCSELNGELSSRCWQCGLRFDGQKDKKIPSFIGPLIVVLVVVVICTCVGMFALKEKKIAVLLAHRHSSRAVIDQQAAITIATLQEAHDASKPGSSYDTYVAALKMAKPAVKEYVTSHDPKATLTKQVDGLLKLDLAIEGLWSRKLKHQGDGLSSSDPIQKKALDRVLEKLPETRDLVISKKGADGQASVYLLPYDAAIDAIWKHTALVLEAMRKEASLPTNPKLASEGDVLYHPSKTIKHPKDLRSPFSPTHSTAMADPLHTKAKKITDAASKPMVATKTAPLDTDARAAISSLAKLDLSYQQGFKPFAAQLNASHLKVADYVKAHGANNPLAKKLMFVVGMETGVEMSWQQKLRTGSQDLQVTDGKDKSELDSIVKAAPELKSKIVVHSRPGSSPIYSLSFDAIIQALRARADALLISANNAA